MSKSFFVLIQARKAALARDYFSRPDYLHGSQLPSLSHSAIFDQINSNALFRKVNYQHPATFTYPIVFLPCFNINGCKWGLKMQSEITRVHI